MSGKINTKINTLTLFTVIFEEEQERNIIADPLDSESHSSAKFKASSLYNFDCI